MLLLILLFITQLRVKCFIVISKDCLLLSIVDRKTAKVEFSHPDHLASIQKEAGKHKVAIPELGSVECWSVKSKGQGSLHPCRQEPEDSSPASSELSSVDGLVGKVSRLKPAGIKLQLRVRMQLHLHRLVGHIG